MKKHSFFSFIALLLTAAVMAPSLLFLAPQPVQAQFGGVVFDPKNFIKNTITSVATVASKAADIAMKINTYVFEPLAFVMSGNLLKAITADVLGVVLGAANGTGIPQFVTDVAASVRTVQDSRALHYIENFDRYSNSPFKSSISSFLRVDYLQETSLNGWYSSHMSTLDRYSPDPDAFLRGDWSQGGLSAWFALTTQDENNPYILAQDARRQLLNQTGLGTGGASGERLTQLGWGDGFMSWCGESDPPAVRPGSAARGVSPVDPCLNKLIKTPGSIIKTMLEDVLGAPIDQITRLGNVGPEINSILGSVATVMNTVNLGSQLLGGSNGLLGAGNSSSANPDSRLSQFTNTPGYFGLTTEGIYQNATVDAGLFSDLLSRANAYESSWTIIRASANSASTSVRALGQSCASYALSVQTVLADTIAPVLSQASQASTTISNARIFAAQAEAAIASGDGTLLSNMQSVETYPPTTEDVSTAEFDATAYGNASLATSSDPFVVSGGSIVDRMNYLRESAVRLQGNCSGAQ